MGDAELALVAMSHTPLLNHVEIPADVRTELESTFATLRHFAERFDPDLVVVLFPDHYNGFFYDLMPPFCLGHAAHSIGDYDGPVGPLTVPSGVAGAVAQSVLDAGVDLAVSHRMQVDHGAVQPLEIMFGAIDAKQVLPVFVNGVAPPFAPMRSVRRLGTALGHALLGLGRRVLVVASGGLSHDPPVPQLDNATAPQRDALLGGGRHLDAQARAARQQRVIDGAAAFARGEADIADLNPGWDQEFLRLLDTGDLDALDGWDAAEMTRVAGHSSHEVRTWVAAYSALATAGAYDTTYSYYRAIPELIAGFGVTTAVTRPG